MRGDYVIPADENEAAGLCASLHDRQIKAGTEV